MAGLGMMLARTSGYDDAGWTPPRLLRSATRPEDAMPEVKFALPAPALRPLITTYYHVTAPGPLEDHLHPEWGNIRFTLHGDWTVTRPGCSDPTPARAALFGPSDRTAIVTATGPAAMVGVGLTAQGWQQLIGQPADAHANRQCDLDRLHGAAADTLWAALMASDWSAMPALFDAYFSNIAGGGALDPQIAAMEQALIDGDLTSVQGFADGLGLNERTCARLCLKIFGFSSKRLLRRQRFLRTLAEIGDRLDQPLASLLDGSYYDQSHFIREFRSYMGMTPVAYFHSPRQMMRRAAIERMRTAGAIVQGLHHAAD
jgi:AraC-like DNA-binding protein